MAQYFVIKKCFHDRQLFRENMVYSHTELQKGLKGTKLHKEAEANPILNKYIIPMDKGSEVSTEQMEMLKVRKQEVEDDIAFVENEKEDMSGAEAWLANAYVVLEKINTTIANVKVNKELKTA